MTLNRYAFIIKAPGYQAIEHTATLASEQFNTQVLGVADLPSAIQAAQSLIQTGVQLIELCGGFSEEEAAQLSQAIHHQVPVGVVIYSKEQTAMLNGSFK
jgi:2-keto-3-deoxy-6-phosphogluconate aldolase